MNEDDYFYSLKAEKFFKDKVLEIAQKYPKFKSYVWLYITSKDFIVTNIIWRFSGYSGVHEMDCITEIHLMLKKYMPVEVKNDID